MFGHTLELRNVRVSVFTFPIAFNIYDLDREIMLICRPGIFFFCYPFLFQLDRDLPYTILHTNSNIDSTVQSDIKYNMASNVRLYLIPASILTYEEPNFHQGKLIPLSHFTIHSHAKLGFLSSLFPSCIH